MRGLCLAIAWLLSPLLFVPLLAEGQMNIRLGGGTGMPIGDLSDGTKSLGPSFLAGVAIPVDLGYYLLIEGHHSRFGIDEEALSKPSVGMDSVAVTKLTGANVGLLIEGIADPVGFYGHGGVGWARRTGRTDLSIEGGDESTRTAGNSFMFVLGVGVNITVSDKLGLTLNARYNHVRDVFDERAQWIPFTASVVLKL